MFEKKYPCEKIVFVNEHLVGFTGQSPSNVDYYYDDGPGYSCQSEDDVADVYHEQFCGCTEATTVVDRLRTEQNIRFDIADMTEASYGEKVTMLRTRYGFSGNDAWEYLKS